MFYTISLLFIISSLLVLTTLEPSFGRCIIDPNEPIPCELPAEPQFVDSSGNMFTEIFPERKVNIQFDIGTRGESEREYVYIVLVKDRNGFTEQLSWTDGVVKDKEIVTASIPWMPEKAEDYTVEVYIWDNLEKPTVFDPTRTTTVTVFPLVRIPLGAADPSQELNYTPSVIKVVLGVNDTVFWLNEDQSPKKVRSDYGYFESEFLLPNQTWSHTFTSVGIYGYHSEPHPWLKGLVIVFPHITEERAIEIAKNAYGEINLNLPIANITANLLYVDHQGGIYEVDKMNLQKQKLYTNTLPLPDEKLERDHYYWNVIFFPQDVVGKVGYGHYIVDATNGEIPQGIRLD